MFIINHIAKNQEQFQKICQKHKLHKLYAFGSGISNEFDLKKSDVDLLVEINANDPLETGELLILFWDAMEQFFKRKVDLLTNESIKNPYLRKSIDQHKKLIYDGQGEEVSV